MSLNSIKDLKRPEVYLSGLVFLILSVIGFSVNTTGDNGDSVMHYLFSHYAFDHPENFLDHWAKPFFVLLTSPFAYFGFKGMVLFNVLCVTFTGLFSYYIAKGLNLKYALLTFPILLGAPLYFKLTFSGLTEYLFALMMVISILLIQKNKSAWAMVIVSFLPMVRSEGLIIVGVFGLFALFNKQFKALPLLLVGQIFYSFVGAIYYQDLLWIIHKIPYSNMDSPYGSGSIFDFVFRLMYVIEKPLMLLLFTGLIILAKKLISKKFNPSEKSTYILITGIFLSIFISHTIFWWLGIFNSMGLPRVLIVIIPQVVIIALLAIEVITDIIKPSKTRNGILVLVMVIILGLPFLSGENSVQYKKDMFEIADHNMIDEEITPFMDAELNDYKDQLIFFSHPYLSVALDMDYFDSEKHMEIQHIRHANLTSGTLIIWDNWFGKVDGGVDLNELTNQSQLEVKGVFKRKIKDQEIQFVILEVI